MRSFSYLLVICVAIVTSCQSQTTGKVLDPAAFQDKIEATSKGIVLDVRTPEEFAEGFIPKAINIDYNNPNFKAEISKLDTAAVYFVYCRSGKRSAAAAEQMRGAGFKNVFELKGGIIAWKENKYAVTSGQKK